MLYGDFAYYVVTHTRARGVYSSLALNRRFCKVCLREGGNQLTARASVRKNKEEIHVPKQLH